MGGESSRVADETTSTSPVQKPDVSHGRQGPGIHLPVCYTTLSPTHRTLLGQRRQQNDIVFRHLFPAGQALSRELLQRLRTEAHAAIRKRLGMHEPALHGRTGRHSHGCYNKIGSRRSDHHRGHSGSLLNRQSGSDSVRAAEKLASDSRHSGRASLELHMIGLPSFIYTHKAHKGDVARRHAPESLHIVTELQRQRPRRSSPTF
jgi:hypothetical protein